MFKTQLSIAIAGMVRPASLALSTSPDQDVEEDLLASSQREKSCLGVLTSGGDAPGMNACVRAVTRMAISKGMRVYAVHEGYQGMVEGGDLIRELRWQDVSDTIHRGGTIIGTARCKPFRERSGRLQASYNLVTRGIHSLVVIGGDGSLTGANLFKQEWGGLLAELVSTDRITSAAAENHQFLNVVGIVGSIDNDMCGTDMTIGVDTALHRIIAAVDCVCSTADSHRRTFVLEVMGRHCGYLALMSSIAGQADWVVLPESPLQPGWEEAMCRVVKQARDNGRRMSLVVVAEGAVDADLRPVSSAYVKRVLEERLQHDTRITVLGHLQRGGAPSFYDRLIGCRLGAAAVLRLAQAEGEVEPVIAGMLGNQVVYKPMMASVKMTQDVNAAMKGKDFERARSLRGPSFQRNLSIALTLNNLVEAKKQDYPLRFAVTQIGAPACGVNSCISAFVRVMLQEGHQVVGIYEGVEGLVLGSPDCFIDFKWIDVDGLVRNGGCILGTNRTLPSQSNMAAIAKQIARLKIHGLFVIGGFEAYQAVTALYKARSTHPEFCIPMVTTPATISNNVPGTDVSLGSDTALNIIVDSCDKLRQSAMASRKRVFVVETHGGNCGYLASMGALAGAADNAYISEEPFGLKDLNEDLQQLKRKFQRGLQKGIVLKNEKAHPDYSTDFIAHYFNGEGKGMFVSRSSVLGHLQQGGAPSPYDRILGVKMGSKVVPFFLDQVKANTRDGRLCANTCESVAVLGMLGLNYVFTPIELLFKKTDFKNRIPLPEHQWWMPLRILMRTLARRLDTNFVGEMERLVSTGEVGDSCKTSISFD